MASGIEGRIFNALADSLDIFASSNKIPIAYPGIAFVPVAQKPYLRPWFLPAQTVALDLANSNDYVGIFQVDVFWPSGQGIKAPLAFASKVCDFFTSFLLQGGDLVVGVNDPPYLGPPLEEPGWLQVPVNIRYRANAHASGVVLSAQAATESPDSAAFAGNVT